MLDGVQLPLSVLRGAAPLLRGHRVEKGAQPQALVCGSPDLKQQGLWEQGCSTSGLQEDGKENGKGREGGNLVHALQIEPNPQQRACGLKNLLTYAAVLWRKARTCSLIPLETSGLSKICGGKKGSKYLA